MDRTLHKALRNLVTQWRRRATEAVTRADQTTEREYKTIQGTEARVYGRAARELLRVLEGDSDATNA